jgi:hypothetical protein
VGAAWSRLGPDRFQCTVIRGGGEILGFVTTVQDGETLVGYYLGLDYAVNSEVPLYFRLLHAVIGEAVVQGCRRVSFGRTALEAKTRLGGNSRAHASLGAAPHPAAERRDRAAAQDRAPRRSTAAEPLQECRTGFRNFLKMASGIAAGISGAARLTSGVSSPAVAILHGKPVRPPNCEHSIRVRRSGRDTLCAQMK